MEEGTQQMALRYKTSDRCSIKNTTLWSSLPLCYQILLPYWSGHCKSCLSLCILFSPCFGLDSLSPETAASNFLNCKIALQPEIPACCCFLINFSLNNEWLVSCPTFAYFLLHSSSILLPPTGSRCGGAQAMLVLLAEFVRGQISLGNECKLPRAGFISCEDTGCRVFSSEFRAVGPLLSSSKHHFGDNGKLSWTPSILFFSILEFHYPFSKPPVISLILSGIYLIHNLMLTLLVFRRPGKDPCLCMSLRKESEIYSCLFFWGEQCWFSVFTSCILSWGYVWRPRSLQGGGCLANPTW